MVETVRSDNAAGQERLGNIYRQELAVATGSLKSHFMARNAGQPIKPEALFAYYRHEFDRRSASGSLARTDIPWLGTRRNRRTPSPRKRRRRPAGAGPDRAAMHSAAGLADEQINTYGWASPGGTGQCPRSARPPSRCTPEPAPRVAKLRSATVSHELKTPSPRSP